jgi:acetyltransferase-like isoleucine patch superfamily enzyme
MHGFEHANEPYKYQKMWKIAPVLVKRGCWIGQNVVIMPGVTVGAFSIIGANSVVTKSIPDRCIAIGAPARVVKTWDERTKTWVAVGETT